MIHPWFLGARSPRVLAHRGFVPPDVEGVTENTFAAFAAAHAAGVEYVESDCHRTADGVVVLFHDADLERLTGDPRKIADVPVNELAEIMSDRGGLVTAEEALEAFPTLRFNLDVKAEAAALPLGRLVARHADRVLLTSFSDARRRIALDAARSAGGLPATSGGQATVARVIAGVAVRARGAVRRALAGVDALQVPERLRGARIVSPALLRAAHDNGVEVHVWTVNEPDDMDRLLAMGVDGIVSDRADLALAAAARKMV